MPTRAHIQALANAREALEPFSRWLVRGCGKTDGEADFIISFVCRALWTSTADDDEDPDPLDCLSEPMITRPTFNKLKSAIRQYYTWHLVRQSSPPSEKERARRQLRRLESILPYGGVGRRAKRVAIDALSQADLKKLMDGLKKWHAEQGRRWPWSYPVISMCLKISPAIRNCLVYLSREELVLALADGVNSGSFNLWVRQKNVPVMRSIPIGLVWKEADMLVGWPWQWETLQDIISSSNASTQNSVNKIKEISFKYYRHVLGDIGDPKTFLARLRYATWVWLLKKTKGDWLSVAQIVGKSVKILRRRPELLEVVSRRLN